MTGLFYLVLFLLAVFAVAFVAYYAWRLLQLRTARDESDRRMQVFMQEVRTALPAAPGKGLPQGTVPSLAPGQSAPSPTDVEGLPVGAVTPSGGPVAPAPAASTPDSGPGLPTRVYERRVALRALSPSPVFLRRDRNGEVTIQIESRAPMPLRYMLDVRARQVLQDVALAATVELGEQWSVLASEDEQGRLVLTRLT